MADTKLILVCKDKPTLDAVVKVLVASGNIAEDEIEAWEEKTWDVKRKTGPIHTKMLFVGDIKDTASLGCFIDIKYERWGICYGLNSRYALITTDTIYIKDNARYKAFLDSYEDAVGKIFETAPTETTPTDEAATKVAKTFGTVGLAVATGGASLAAQKLIDDNKTQLEKTNKLCLFGAWHFAENQLEEFVGE